MTCSFAWDDAGLPAWGTAPRGDFWVALQQNGPWGNRAFTQSRLDPSVGAGVESAALDAGGRALLIRPPASHADHADHPHRQVFVAGGLAGTPWLLGGVVAEPERVLELPWELLAGAEPSEVLARVGWLEPMDGGVLLVCANGKRDLCCALRGRPIALELERVRPGRVWECTHTGGHRFAPTGVLLPSGQSVARLTSEVARAALAAADSGALASETFGPWHDRGRGHLPPEQAVAEAFVRALTGETDPAALVACPPVAAEDPVTGAAGRPHPRRTNGQAWTVLVTHADGRTWTILVESVRHADDLPQSCAKTAVAAGSWSALLLDRVQGRRLRSVRSTSTSRPASPSTVRGSLR